MADCTGRCQDCLQYSRDEKVCKLTKKFTNRKGVCDEFKARKVKREHYEMSALR